MAKKNFSVDDTLYKAQAKKLVRELKLDETKFVRDQGALYAKLSAKMTPPFVGGKFPNMKGKGYQEGTNAENLLQGRAAIIQDMAMQFTVKPKGYLEFLHKITGKTRDIRQPLRTKKGEPYVVDIAEINYNSPNRAKEFAQSKRIANGRSSRFPKTQKMWITQEIWQAVYVEKFLNVGMSKAAFAAAAVRLAVKQKPPTWIKKHISSSGTRVTVKSNPTIVTINASAPGLAHTERSQSKVASFRIKAMVIRLKHLVKADAKKAGFKTR